MNKKAFTLVEIMVVVVIIGFLVAIAIPNFVSMRTNAQEQACKAHLRQLNAALEMYRIDNGSYPTAANWAALIAGTDLDTYMNSVPADCPGTGAYAYDNVNGVVTCSATGHSI